MKKILSLILALIFICCFGACQNNPPTPDDPSPDPHNTPQVQATYRMEEAEYSLPQKQFLAIPSHNDSRLLVIESDGSGYDPAHNNAFVYQLISQQETNLSGYAFDARLVGDTVYWLGLVPDESGKRSMHLLKTDLSGSSTETVYTPPTGYQFIEAMSSDSSKKVIAEYDVAGACQAVAAHAAVVFFFISSLYVRSKTDNHIARTDIGIVYNI